jgi:hypothetical protein
MRHPDGGGTNESIPKPVGTVITIVLVVTPAFSVGTARLYSWSLPDSDTAGLIRACADANAGKHNPAAPNSIAASAARPVRDLSCKVVLLVSGDRDRAADAAPTR